MKIRFTITGQPIGKNNSRGMTQGRFFVPKATKVWQRRVAVAAHAAAVEAGWPDNPFAVSRAAYRIFRYSVRGDADRGDTYAVDAMQLTRWWTPKGEQKIITPIGLYGNDSDAYCAGSYPSVKEGAPRIEIEVTIEAIRAAHEADELLRRWYKNEARRALRRKARLDSKEFNTGKKVTESAAARRSRDELAVIERDRGLSLF